MKNDALLQLRNQIDSIDDQIIDLLKNRVEIVKRVGELKKETSASQSFIRAGREASMLRNLIKKADNIFPPAAIATIWRMVISASLSIEQNISIYAYSGADNNCFWLAREYFGTFLEIHPNKISAKMDADKVINAVAKNPSAVGVLPLIDHSENPWWVRPKTEANDVYVFARIPFVEEESEIFKPVLAIANTCPEATSEDVSLLAITANITEEKLLEIFKQHQLDAEIISRSGSNNFLVEVAKFIPIGDSLVNAIKTSISQDAVVRLMGSYAVPVRI